MIQAVLDHADAHERWYVVRIPVHNPVTAYRAWLDEPAGYPLAQRARHAFA